MEVPLSVGVNEMYLEPGDIIITLPLDVYIDLPPEVTPGFVKWLKKNYRHNAQVVSGEGMCPGLRVTVLRGKPAGPRKPPAGPITFPARGAE
jgi:hypothetical protein